MPSFVRKTNTFAMEYGHYLHPQNIILTGAFDDRISAIRHIDGDETLRSRSMAERSDFLIRGRDQLVLVPSKYILVHKLKSRLVHVVSRPYPPHILRCFSPKGIRVVLSSSGSLL
ncbi:unnamed protein product [Agarophyton chilense]